MKTSFALLLQIVVVAIGVATMAFMLWEPHIEGRNAHATVFEIYFKDPFLAYVYLGSIPFFVALYRAFKLFGDARQNGAFSQATLDALRVVKRCLFVTIGFVAGAAVIIVVSGDNEDRPAGIFMCFIAVSVLVFIALAAAKFARSLRTALERSNCVRS